MSKQANDYNGGVTIATELDDGRELVLRSAVAADRAVLEAWDREPDVISATTDTAGVAWAGDHDWAHELAAQSEDSEYFIAELAGRPIGAMQIIDPHEEPTHYWGEIEPGLRAVDIWIGSPADRGRGYGSIMMTMAEVLCFDGSGVKAIVIDPLNSNVGAHRFYQRLGYVPTHRQIFNGEDDCLVHKLTRADWLARNNANKGA